METRCPPFPLRQLSVFWLPEMILPGVAAVHARFEPRPDGILLASFPKSGTTWLKALAFATLNREENPPSNPGHPLGLRNPHDCVSFFESTGPGGARQDVFEALPSPRLLATHTPYSLLPERVVASCRVVYVCRDPSLGIENASFFRKGAAGDWRNHLTPEMAARLDEIVDGALQGSGLTFGGEPNVSE